MKASIVFVLLFAILQLRLFAQPESDRFPTQQFLLTTEGADLPILEGMEPDPNRFESVQIEPGESIYQVLEREGVTVSPMSIEWVREANDLADSDEISPGQMIAIPRPRGLTGREDIIDVHLNPAAADRVIQDLSSLEQNLLNLPDFTVQPDLMADSIDAIRDARNLVEAGDLRAHELLSTIDRAAILIMDLIASGDPELSAEFEDSGRTVIEVGLDGFTKLVETFRSISSGKRAPQVEVVVKEIRDQRGHVIDRARVLYCFIQDCIFRPDENQVFGWAPGSQLIIGGLYRFWVDPSSVRGAREQQMFLEESVGLESDLTEIRLQVELD